MSYPERSAYYVYVLYDAQSVPVYVGYGANPFHRFREHRLYRPWWSRVTHHRLIGPFPSRDAARLAEAELIRNLQPSENSQHTGRRMHHHRIVGGNCRACAEDAA